MFRKIKNKNLTVYIKKVKKTTIFAKNSEFKLSIFKKVRAEVKIELSPVSVIFKTGSKIPILKNSNIKPNISMKDKKIRYFFCLLSRIKANFFMNSMFYNFFCSQLDDCILSPSPSISSILNSSQTSLSGQISLFLSPPLANPSSNSSPNCSAII